VAINWPVSPNPASRPKNRIQPEVGTAFAIGGKAAFDGLLEYGMKMSLFWNRTAGSPLVERAA
jgi:hypothetical protein